MVEVDIVTLTQQNSFNATAIQYALTAAVDAIVSDDKIGSHNVSTTGAVEMGTANTGTNKQS